MSAKSVKNLRLLKNLTKLNRWNKIDKKNKSIFDVKSVEEFEERVKCSNRPVLIDFHASWCVPCKAQHPRLENIVSEQRGRIRLARVDVDDLADLALNYNISSVPSLLVMHNGNVLKRLVGLQPSEYLRECLKKFINL